MPPKKTKIDYAAMHRATHKSWKETPPGREQLELERLFKSKIIDHEDSIQDVRKSNALFIPFSLAVFSSHFRKTRAKMGLYTASVDASEENSNNEIPQLGSCSSINLSDVSVHNINDEQSTIQFVNPPYVAWIYTNHVMKCDFVCVTLPIISGSQDINFVISEDGLQLTINYSWLNAIYDPFMIFREELDADPDITIDDPIIHAMRSHLLECGLTPKSNPRGSIVISLPKKVRREEGTFKKKAIQTKDANIILLQLMAYQKNRVIDEVDTSISFK